MAQGFIDAGVFVTLVKRLSGEIVSSTDDYALLMISAAEEIVRDEAAQPGWVGGPSVGLGETLAPQRARIIATMLAARSFSDKGNLARRAAGPIAESFRDGGPGALELTDAELDWLRSQRPGGGRRTGIVHVGAGIAGPFYDDLTPDGYSIAAGDLDFAHGMHIEDV